MEKSEARKNSFFYEQTIRVSRKERSDLTTVNRIRDSDFDHQSSLYFSPFFFIFSRSFPLFFFFLFALRCQPQSPQNRGRSSRFHYWSRGNVNTCLATTDLSERIKNTISGREPANACLIESRRNHGKRFSRHAAFRSADYSALKTKKAHRSVPSFTRLASSFNIPSSSKIRLKKKIDTLISMVAFSRENNFATVVKFFNVIALKNIISS